MEYHMRSRTCNDWMSHSVHSVDNFGASEPLGVELPGVIDAKIDELIGNQGGLAAKATAELVDRKGRDGCLPERLQDTFLGGGSLESTLALLIVGAVDCSLHYDGGGMLGVPTHLGDEVFVPGQVVLPDGDTQSVVRVRSIRDDR